jgi:hypothetical protein
VQPTKPTPESSVGPTVHPEAQAAESKNQCRLQCLPFPSIPLPEAFLRLVKEQRVAQS